MVGRFTTVSFSCRCTRGRGISCEEPDIILGLEFKKWGSRCRCGCPKLREVLRIRGKQCIYVEKLKEMECSEDMFKMMG